MITVTIETTLTPEQEKEFSNWINSGIETVEEAFYEDCLCDERHFVEKTKVKYE